MESSNSNNKEHKVQARVHATNAPPASDIFASTVMSFATRWCTIVLGALVVVGLVVVLLQQQYRKMEMELLMWL